MAKKNERSDKLIDNLVLENSFRARKDISNWRTALQMAEKVENPKRVLLYNLYDELILDSQLSAEMQKRVLAVRGSRFSLYDPETGETDEEKTELLKQPWFYKFLEGAMDSVFWGHTLFQIKGIEDGIITDIELVPRKHIVPNTGLFLRKTSDEKGIYYRENPSYAPWLIEYGKPDDLGLINKAAPHILYKRFSLSAWSEFCEIFGMPIRIGRTNVKDQESLNRMENMLINMGTAPYAVIDDEEDIEFRETVKSNGEVYNGLINRSNTEISKLINGAVTGEDSSGGSRAKEEVGERTGSLISQADKMSLVGYINFVLLPKIINLGSPFEGLKFRFDKTKDVDKVWEVTKGLLSHYDIDEEFIAQTFGIPVQKKPDVQPGTLNSDSFF